MGEQLLNKPKVNSDMASIIKKSLQNPLAKPVTTPNADANTIEKKVELAPVEASTAKETTETNARIVCYYTNWSQKRPGAYALRYSRAAIC